MRALLLDSRAAFTAAGTDCLSFLAGEFAPQERETFRYVRVEPAKVERNGDTALVLRGRSHVRGRPSDDEDTPTVRRNGAWWIAGGI